MITFLSQDLYLKNSDNKLSIVFILSSPMVRSGTQAANQLPPGLLVLGESLLAAAPMFCPSAKHLHSGRRLLINLLNNFVPMQNKSIMFYFSKAVKLNQMLYKRAQKMSLMHFYYLYNLCLFPKYPMTLNTSVLKLFVKS